MSNRDALVDSTGVVQSVLETTPAFATFTSVPSGQTRVFDVPDVVSAYNSHKYNSTTASWDVV